MEEPTVVLCSRRPITQKQRHSTENEGWFYQDRDDFILADGHNDYNKGHQISHQA